VKALGVAVCVLLLVGCGTSSTPGSAGPQSITSPPTPSAGSSSPAAARSPSPRPTSATPASSEPSPGSEPRGTTVVAADSRFGSILFDASAQAIYLFDAEQSSHPKCYGNCADAWPPVLTKGKPQGKAAVRSELLGTTRRSDGAIQVTYAGHPLYFYAHEGKRQVLCHNVKEFGGTWLAVQPDGDPAPH
jgi:predicted lipoprotein with Yx(FWY)xxD motif